jgi:hypothetical protein
MCNKIKLIHSLQNRELYFSSIDHFKYFSATHSELSCGCAFVEFIRVNEVICGRQRTGELCLKFKLGKKLARPISTSLPGVVEYIIPIPATQEAQVGESQTKASVG